MIFPIHPAYAELRPGMGYAPGARALGYAPGARAMGFMPGARALGAISSIMMDNAHSGGIATEDLVLLSSVGATDNDVEDLLNGNTTLAELYAKYGVSFHAPDSATPSGGQSSASSGVGQVPAGSRLLYTANWTAGIGNLSVSANSAISNLSNLAASRNLQVTGASATSNGPIHYAIEIHVLDTIGHQYTNDVKSVLDALLQQVVGNNLNGTELAITAVPNTSGQVASPDGTPKSFTQWLQDNALMVGIGVAAIFLGPPLIKKL
jgi:hypothetical protein